MSTTTEPSSSTHVPTDPTFTLRPLTRDQLGQNSAPTDWLWHGFLARGNITLLTSQWKVGKTTLLAALLAQLKTGGDFVGFPLTTGKALILSEENQALWFERQRKMDFGEHTWLCRPFRACLNAQTWHALVGHITALHRAHQFDLIVIDPLSSFLPGYGENDLFRLKPSLAVLQELADLGPALLLLHHPRKGPSQPGQSARGCGLLTSFVDIIIEMYPYHRADEADRRRRLQTYSRHEATPPQWVIELNEAGTAFTGLGDMSAADYLHDWPTLHRLLAESKYKITQKELLEKWPLDAAKPAVNTLWRWLENAAREGLVVKSGPGTKSEPCRYCLPGQPEQWLNDPTRTPTVNEILEMAERIRQR
jgi:hypothetical protein